MPTLRRSAKKDATEAAPPLDVDETSRAIEPVATKLESIATSAKDGAIEALGVVNDKAVGAAGTGANRSKLPATIQFPLLTLISFSISSLLYSFLNEWTGSELAHVAKSLDTWTEVGVLASWRIIELALGWFGNFDSLDLAGLNLLAHGPTVYLLATFYKISAPTAVAAVAIEMVSTFIPFQLLRPLSGVHAGGKDVANREIVTDIPIAVYTTLLSSIVYGVVLFTALHTYLPKSFVLYFEGIPSLEPAYTANYLSILPVMLVFGFAARTFIFTPFAAQGSTKEDEKLDEFNPVLATLGETIAWNFSYTTRAKVIIKRTVVAMLVTGLNTYVQTSMTIGGVESRGAVSYAGVWVAATFLVGSALAFVGGEA